MHHPFEFCMHCSRKEPSSFFYWSAAVHVFSLHTCFQLARSFASWKSISPRLLANKTHVPDRTK